MCACDITFVESQLGKAHSGWKYLHYFDFIRRKHDKNTVAKCINYGITIPWHYMVCLPISLNQIYTIINYYPKQFLGNQTFSYDIHENFLQHIS